MKTRAHAVGHEIISLESVIAWGVASRPMPAQDVCGDLHLVKAVSEGVLLAVVDGLGHGNEAAAAAQAALATLECCGKEPLDALFWCCHDALKRTRGVVMTVARLNGCESRLSWLGVGTVEALLLRASEDANASAVRPVLRGGVVGYKLPPLHTSTLPITAGDLLVFATDGIRAGFAKGLARSDSPQQIADQIVERHFKGTDDALVLVARYLGKAFELN